MLIVTVSEPVLPLDFRTLVMNEIDLAFGLTLVIHFEAGGWNGKPGRQLRSLVSSSILKQFSKCLPADSTYN